MNPLCTNCFERNAKKICGRCGCRYCSQDCQAQDWRNGHKTFCGKAGQWGRDYEIKPSPNKIGLGIFALRDFKKYETVIVDREATVGPNGDIPSPTDDRLESSYADRVKSMTTMGVSENELEHAKKQALVIGRVNHDCLANTRQVSAGDRGLLKAVRDIAAGEEICFPYYDELHPAHLGLPFDGSLGRQFIFENTMRFECKCVACSTPDVDVKLGRLKAMIQQISTVGATVDITKAKENAEKMLALADELGCAPPIYFMIYSTLYTVMIRTGNNKEEAKELAAKLNEIGTQWYGPGSEEANFAADEIADANS